jgi:hypothetical protein
MTMLGKRAIAMPGTVREIADDLCPDCARGRGRRGGRGYCGVRTNAAMPTSARRRGDLVIPQRAGLSRLILGKQAGSQQLGDAMPDGIAQAADDTRKLRARFPRWGILFDPLESVWIAVRGKRTLVAASSPEKLTEQVEAAARGEAGPDEGDKTQTWRALRKQRRG